MRVEKIKERLLRRRDGILNREESQEASWERLREPEVELEEVALKRVMTRTIEELEERERQEVEQIDAALGKLETSGYGICESCGRNIREARLEAIPWTPYCVECARRLEGSPAALREVETGESGGGPAGEDEAYTDDEIREMIRDQLIRDDRIETEELRIAIENGTVYLEGFLPGKTQHELLIGIVQDVLGFKKIVDRVQIDRQLWENRRRTEGIDIPEKAEEEEKMESDSGETDVWESRQAGTSLTPPDKLDSEKKPE